MLTNETEILFVRHASELDEAPDEDTWLIEKLWLHNRVGIIGGEPKCCKSFFALELAISVASGTRAFDKFEVKTPMPVLFFAAEDCVSIIKGRIKKMCRGKKLRSIDLNLNFLVTPSLRLDREDDQKKLFDTIEAIGARLLILDPLIRVHRAGENSAGQMAYLLSFLRTIQTKLGTSVMVVHHMRKNSNTSRSGQALRGSSELHAWGDSNLFLSKREENLITVEIEQRAARPHPGFLFKIVETKNYLKLKIHSSSKTRPDESSNKSKIISCMVGEDRPLKINELRKLVRIRKANLCSVIAELVESEMIIKCGSHYSLVSVGAGYAKKHPALESGLGSQEKPTSVREPEPCG